MSVSTMRRQVLGGVLWTVLQRWSGRLLTLATFIVLGRLLEPREFGLVALATVFIGLLNVFSDFGLSSYLVQAEKVDQRDTSTVFWFSLGLSFALALLVAAAAPLIAMLFREPHLTPVLVALSSLVLITAFSSTPIALLKRDLRFKAIAVRSVFATALSGIAAVGLALLGAGVWSLVAQAVVFNVTSAVVLWATSGWRPTRAFDRRLARTAGGYGLSVMGIGLVNQLRQRSDALIIGAIAGTTVLGYWSVGTRIISVVFETAVAVIATVSTPTFARLKADKARLQRGYVAATSSSLAIISPVLVTLAVVSPWLIPLAFGEKWADTVPVAQILVVPALLNTMVYFNRGLMLALGRQRVELRIALIATVAGMALVAALSPLGLVAIAIASLLRALVSWPLRLRVTSQVLEMPMGPYVRDLFRTVLAAAAAAVPATAIALLWGDTLASWAVVVICTAVVAVGYLPLLYLINRPVARLMRSALGDIRPAPTSKEASGTDQDRKDVHV